MKHFLISLLFLIFYGCYLLFTQLLFGDNNLIELKGKLQNKRNFVQLEMKNDKTIEYAYLTFKLKNDKRNYILKVDINHVHQGFNVFGGVNKSLRDAGQISVWIKKADYVNISPTIYKIETDGLIIFELKKKPGNNGRLFLVLTILSSLFLLIYAVLKNSERISICFKKWQNKNHKNSSRVTYSK